MKLGYSRIRKSPSIPLFQSGKLWGEKLSPSLKKRGQRRFWTTAALFVSLFGSGLHDRAAAADPTTIYAGYGGIAGYQMPLWVMKEAEIGKKYGVDLEPLLISGGALGMQALLANSIQLSQNSASAAAGAALRGAPIALVSTSENRMAAEIVSRAEIKTPQQLIGKKIGILRFGGSNDTAIQWALRAWKIDPKQVTNITVFVVGPWNFTIILRMG